MLVTQLRPALGDPMDGSPPGSSVHGILQARILEWVVIPFSGDLPHPQIEPRSPALQADALPSEPPGKVKEESEKSSLNSTFQKTKIMASSAILHGKLLEKKWKH